VTIEPVSIRIVGNSGQPYGWNDGPVWAGRGLTGVASAGLTIRHKVLTASLQPIGFLAQNTSFTLASNGLTGNAAFADWAHPIEIDQPQRFGSGSYGRIDAGESFARIDWRGAAVGVSTASEIWGPAVDHPVILGNNAGGIPRLFIGTSGPARIGPLRFTGEWFWGELSQSSYSVLFPAAGRRFTTAGIGSIGFGRSTQFEVGASRFFHAAWPGHLSDAPWLAVFEGILKNSLTSSTNPNGDSGDNQLASLFFRVTAAPAGIEFYGEYGREDHNADLRDLAKEPDHDAAYLLGFQKTIFADDRSRMTVVHAEAVNGRISHLQQTASQAPWYLHTVLRQGHTLRGQVLGSAGLFGGGGATFSIDRYGSRGRTTFRWDRLGIAEFLNGESMPVGERADVIHALSLERMQFMRNMELTVTTTISKEFNRYFERDSYNLNLTAGARLHP